MLSQEEKELFWGHLKLSTFEFSYLLIYSYCVVHREWERAV